MMDIEEYSRRVIDTTEEDWTVITCWGFGSGPSYLQNSSVVTKGKDEFSNIEIESHGMRATLKSDLLIWFACGYLSNPDFKEPWANQFSDPHASSSFVDFFYNGVLVFRDIFVSVDGGRCYLPLPDREFDPETYKVLRYTVPRDKYTFFKMLNSIDKLSDFDRYFQRAGFEIVDTPWMV
jgi:hypothetical protein